MTYSLLPVQVQDFAENRELDCLRQRWYTGKVFQGDRKRDGVDTNLTDKVRIYLDARVEAARSSDPPISDYKRRLGSNPCVLELAAIIRCCIKFCFGVLEVKALLTPLADEHCHVVELCVDQTRESAVICYR